MDDLKAQLIALDQLTQAAVDYDAAETEHKATAIASQLHRLKEAARTFARLQRAVSPAAAGFHVESCAQCREPVRVDGVLGFSPVRRAGIVLCFGCAPKR